MNKKIIILFLSILFVLSGCANNTVQNSEVDTSVEVNQEENDEVTMNTKIIRPLKMDLDTNNLEDVILNCFFYDDDLNVDTQTIKLGLFEQDIYDAVDIHSMSQGDTIIVGDAEYPVETVKEENGYIDINGGYTESEFGMTFAANEGGTYRTLLLDDYSTYSKIGDVELKISDDFELIDYVGDEPNGEGIKVTLNDYQEYTENLEEWNKEFFWNNTEVHIVNNEVVSIIRYWVP